MSPRDGQTWGPLIGIGVAAVILVLRMRGGKPRPLSVATMWIIPALLLAGFVATAATSRLLLADYGWVVLALAAGSALGWQRGRMMAIHIDETSGAPMVKASPAALVFILVLMALRIGLKQLVESGAVNWHIDPLLVTDAFFAFAVGFLGVARLEMYLRARKLGADRQGAGKLVV